MNAFQVLRKKEELKPYDDLESQTQMWNEKIAQEFDLRGLLGLPVDLELAKTTLALENNVPIKQKFVGKLKEIGNVIQAREKAGTTPAYSTPVLQKLEE